MSTLIRNKITLKFASTSWRALAAALLVSSVLAVPQAVGANLWNFRGGPDGGYISSVAVDPTNPNIVYVTNYAGVYKTTNGGTNWTSLNAYFGAGSSIIIDPSNPHTIYLVSGLVIKSTDAGVNWTVLDTKNSCKSTARALVIDTKSTSTLYVILMTVNGTTTDYSVVKSTNGGGTWTTLAWKAYALAVDPANSSILYASMAGGLQKSTDGGGTWNAAGTGLPSGTLGTVVVDPKTPTTLYLVAGENAIYKSTNSGGQWSISSTGISGKHLKDPVIDPINPGNLFLIASETTIDGDIYRTSNGGAQWNKLNLGLPTADAQAVALAPSNPATLYTGSFTHGVLKSIDSGATWVAKNSGLIAWANQLALDPTNKNNVYLGINGLGVFQSTDGGVNWVSRNASLPSLAVSDLVVSPVNSQVLYVSLNNATELDLGGSKIYLPGIYKSTNGGTSWSATTTPPDNFGFVAPMKMAGDPVDANGVYALGLGTGVYHSTDGGGSWSSSKTGLPSTAFPYSIAIDPKTPANIYVGVVISTTGTPQVYKSTDSGVTWNPSGAGLPNGLGVYDLAIDPKTPATLYAAALASQTVDGGIYKSIDSGASWTDASNGIRNFDWKNFYNVFYDNIHFSGPPLSCEPSKIPITAMHLAIDPTTPATLFSVVDGIVFRTTDAAGNWTVAHSGLFFTLNEIAVSSADHNVAYAASQGLYVYNGSGGGGGTTSVTVSSPNGRESWAAGSAHTITWTTSGTVANVKIEISTDGGTSYSTIAASTANTGSYSWTVPNTPSSNCKVRISDAAGTVSDTSDGNFTIGSAGACSYAINPSSHSFGLSGGTGSVAVTTDSGCAWTAASNVSWITTTGGTSGSGNGTVNYSVASASSARSGTMTIAGKTFTVSQGATTGESTDLFVPIVLSSGGAGGSFYTTELTFGNLGGTTAQADLTYTGAANLGGGSGTASTSFSPGQKVVSNSIEYLKGLGIPIPASGNRGGTLRVHFSNLSTSSAASITARTGTEVKNSSGSLLGRAGLAYAAIPVDSSSGTGLTTQAITVAQDALNKANRPAGSVTPISTALSTPAYICGLRQTSTDRSNVAFQNAGAAGEGPITLQVTVFDGNSSFFKVLPSFVLDPGGFSQIGGVLGSNGLSLTNGYVKVERLAGSAPYYAYGVINDQANSDGSFVIPQPASTAPVAGLTLPVVVQNSSFLSEVVLANFSSQARSVNFNLVADAVTTPDKTARFTINLPAGRQQIIPDIFAYMRSNSVAGIGAAGTTIAGALFATATGGDISGVVLGARTSASGGSAGGRFGLYYSAVPYGQASTDSAWLLGLQQNSENRTNLAIVNTGETDGNSDTFVIDLYDGATGAKVKSMDPIVLKARGWTQIPTVLTNATGQVQQGYAHVRRTAGANPFITYAVVNDGAGPGARTGDGAYVGSSD